MLDAEGVERAHVVGASMGGVIAQIIGVLHPERVAVAGARVHRVPPPRLAARAARGVGRRRRRARHARAGGRRRHAVARRAAAAAPVRRVAQRARPRAHADDARAVRRAGATRSSMPATSCASSCRRSRVPTLVITGSQDTLTPRRRRRGARRADPDAAALRAQRRRARPHGRGAERVQRRGAPLPRRGRRDATLGGAAARPRQDDVAVAGQRGAGGARWCSRHQVMRPSRSSQIDRPRHSTSTSSSRRRRGSSSRRARCRRRPRARARRTTPACAHANELLDERAVRVDAGDGRDRRGA